MDFLVRDILSLSDPKADEPRDPMVSAQASMRASLPKRFYKQVETGERDGAHHVLLDGRAVKTPGKNTLAFATADAAGLVAAEFDRQGEEIDPNTMPCYRLANTAIDGVASDMQAVLEDVLRYCGTDARRSTGHDGSLVVEIKCHDGSPENGNVQERMHRLHRGALTCIEAVAFNPACPCLGFGRGQMLR